MNKKSIVFVIGSLNIGGAETSLVNLLKLLNYEKITAEVIVFVKNGKLEEQIPKEVKITHLDMPELPLPKKLLSRFERYIKPNTHPVQIHWKYLKNKFNIIDEKYDIGIAYNQGFATYFVSKFIQSNKKYFWQNSDYLKAKYDVNLDIPYFKEFDGIVAVSELAKITIENAIKPKGLITPIYIIKDISNKELILKKSQEEIDINFSSDFINIVTVGRLVKPKGLEMAIESCNLLTKKGYNVRWFVIGEGPERRRLIHLIKKYKLDNNFFLLGAKSNPFPYIKNCDIYVQTSWFEGLGLTLIEAKYLNKPIVSTDFDTSHTILSNNITGLITSKNKESIVEGILRYVENPKFKDMVIKRLSQLEDNDIKESLDKFNKKIAEI